MKKIIFTDKAPAPIGPYNQATLHNDTLYVSGQIALDPASGEMKMGSIEEETHQVMKNLGAVLEAAGTNFENVLKCSVFVSDMNDYARINAVYGEYFNDDTAPCRALVEVANLPKFVNVEISCIAIVE